MFLGFIIEKLFLNNSLNKGILTFSPVFFNLLLSLASENASLP